MLRVITKQTGDVCRIELHGMLGGEWVQLLDEHWRSIVREAPSATVVVVLSEVEFIDPAGEQLLGRMADSGVEFIVSGCLNRYVVKKLSPNMGQRNRTTNHLEESCSSS